MTYISERNGAKIDALLDKVESGDLDNLYVADFTIHDLSLLLYGGEIESLEVNGKALLQALEAHKVIGVLVDNDTPSMLLACAYKVSPYIYLYVYYGSQVYMASIALSDNYDEVEESKSGLISKGNIYDYPLDYYHQYHLEFDSNSVYEAYWNNQEITCDYNALYSAVDTDNDIRIFAGVSGSVPVNAYFVNDDTICLSYIVEDTLWKLLVYRSEADNGNVYGHVLRDEIAHINLHDTKNGSRYIITDFTIENILDNDIVTITSELVKAITDNRPLAIYYATGESDIFDITKVSSDLATQTRISLKVSYRGGGNLIIDSPNVVTEGGMTRASSYWEADPDKTRSITNSSGGIIHSDDGVITVPPSFFADKSLEYNRDNNQMTLVPIRNQITILDKPLMGNGRFSFSPPLIGVAVEYTIKFRVGAQCSWSIVNSGGSSLVGNFYGRTLSDIPAGNYLMKITLFTYINTKGTVLTEYIAEIMVVSK